MRARSDKHLYRGKRFAQASGEQAKAVSRPNKICSANQTVFAGVVAVLLAETLSVVLPAGEMGEARLQGGRDQAASHSHDGCVLSTHLGGWDAICTTSFSVDCDGSHNLVAIDTFGPQDF